MTSSWSLPARRIESANAVAWLTGTHASWRPWNKRSGTWISSTRPAGEAGSPAEGHKTAGVAHQVCRRGRGDGARHPDFILRGEHQGRVASVAAPHGRDPRAVGDLCDRGRQ